MARKVVFANNKGGVGKTTSAVSVSAFLASMGKRVLALDFDPQSNLTVSFGVDIISLEKSMCEVFEDRCAPEDAVLNVLPGLDVVPARPGLDKVVDSGFVSNHLRKNEIIKFRLSRIEERYDFMIMDTAPATQGVLAMNSLSFADYVVIPVQFEHFSVVGLRQMLDIISSVKEQFLNPGIRLAGILGTFYSNTRNCRSHEKMVENRLREFVFGTKIRKNVSLSECSGKGIPITRYDRKSNGYKDYEAFTEELLSVVSD